MRRYGLRREIRRTAREHARCFGVDRPTAMAYIRPPFAVSPRNDYDAGWSSPVARQAHNLKVTGSNPVPATKIAQLIQVVMKTGRPVMGGLFSIWHHIGTTRSSFIQTHCPKSSG